MVRKRWEEEGRAFAASDRTRREGLLQSAATAPDGELCRHKPIRVFPAQSIRGGKQRLKILGQMGTPRSRHAYFGQQTAALETAWCIDGCLLYGNKEEWQIAEKGQMQAR